MSPAPEDAAWGSGLGAQPASSHEATAAIPAVDRPYHAKRSHKKSRTGCQSCKTRKVKCDEARPRCRACTLRKETCVYPSAAHPAAGAAASSRGARVAAASSAATAAAAAASTAAAAAAEAAVVPASSASSSSSSSGDGEGGLVPYHDYSRGSSPAIVASEDFNVTHKYARATSSKPWGAQGQAGFSVETDGFSLLDEPLFLPVQIDQTDMKLLWFYTAKGFDAFAAEAGRQPKVDEILQVAIPRHAFGRRFLMDCLLALSALELQMLNQPIEPSRVLMYRARAFAGYRRAVEEADPDTFPALLACSLLLCALSSQMFRDIDRKPLYILDWMVVWRGIGLMVKITKHEALFESGMSMLFARPPINLDASTKYIPNQLLYMVSSIRQDDPDFTHIDLYYKTLKYLGSLYRELESGMGRLLNLRTITWFTFLPKEFVDVAREHRPRALIIIAHYLIFVKLCNRLWWMQGIADKEINDIKDILEDEWQPYLAAPLQALETEDDITIGKILLNNNNWTPDYFYDPVRDSQTKSLTLVDNSGHNIIYNGAWVQEDTGEPAAWNFPEHVGTSAAVLMPEEVIGLRRLSLENLEGSLSPEDTADEDTGWSQGLR